ncbi:MAG: secretin and TonB N-terminal domain-containing protein [Armatimonadetes bacterium]|nr:secretin and TonB N-terminal domain-containing protein [Armatimonadota bacterium]
MQVILKRWQDISATAASVAKMSCVAAIAIVAFAGSAMAIDLEVKDCPLKQVINTLIINTGSDIMIVDDAKLDKRVTATLKNRTLESALDTILEGSGVSYRVKEDGTIMIGGSSVDVPTIVASDMRDVLTPVVVLAPEPEPAAVVAPRIIREVIKLTYSNATELLALIQPIHEEIASTDPFEAFRVPIITDRASNPLTVIDQQGRSYNPSTVNSGNGVPRNNVAIPTQPGSADPGAGRTADINTGAGQFPVGVPGRPTTTPNPATGTAGTTTGTLMPADVSARAFELDNSIIVMGTEEGIDELKKLIRMLDVPPKQVSIKAEFVEVKTTDIKKFGIDWSLDRINESFNTSFGPVGNVIFGFNRGNLTAQIRAQLTTDVGRVINAPIISTINNMMASLQVNTMIPYWETVSTVVGNTVINQAVPRFINVSTNLMVMPRVNGDGTITMQLSPTISDTGQIISGPSGQSIPETKTMNITTYRRVANGETIVIGGFIRKNDSNSFQRIPILADLPIIGTLFRTRSRQMEDREVLIFITATIIADVNSNTIGNSLTP